MTSHKSFSLQGKVAIVTGGSRGLGAGIAIQLASLGCLVAITYVSESSTPLASALIATIKDLPSRTSAISIRADLRLATAPAFIVQTVREAFDQDVDILVNNAGCCVPRGLGEIGPQDWAATWDLNVKAVVMLTQDVIKVMRAPGRIINILGPKDDGTFGDAGLYFASKAAVESLTRSWASQLGGDGTTVNAVQPPIMQTRLTSTLLPPETLKMAAAASVQGRLGTVDDVAQVVGFLCEERSRFVTGGVIDCSGGRKFSGHSGVGSVVL